MSGLKDIKIMAIDDEPSILFAIKSTLSEYSIETYSDPEAALFELKANPYDIFIVDHVMSPRSGLDLLKEITKSYTHYSSILLSAYIEKNLLEEMA
jgi:DNA-binding NtrC family response regulator